MVWIVEYSDHDDIKAWSGFADHLSKFSPVEDDFLVELLKEFVNEGDTLLDLGCSAGLYTELFSKNGFKCTGVDQIPKAIDYASRRVSNTSFICADIIDLNLKEKFDIIFTRTVVQHVKHHKKDRFLKSINRNLKLHGIYYMVEDCLGVSDGWHDLDIITNECNEVVQSEYVYSPYQWISLVESYGFKCIKHLFDAEYCIKGKYKRSNMIFKKISEIPI